MLLAPAMVHRGKTEGMTKDVVVWISFQDAQGPRTLEAALGHAPLRICQGKDKKHLVQYDLRLLLVRGVSKRLACYVEDPTNPPATLDLDLAVMMPSRLYTKTIRVPKNVLTFVKRFNASLSVSVYMSD